jgi:prepilin-type N-terminal cleavage/methylation domain-containing protein
MHPLNTLRPARTLPPSTRGFAQGGFTLAELAIVLVILSLLAGGLMVPLGARVEARDRQLSLDRLRDIQQALTGFAIIHGRLPCPSTEDDPGAPGYGIEDSPPCNTAREGRLPWLSLGLPPTDAWGLTRRNRGDDWGGHWHYRVDRAFADTPISAATAPADDLQIRAHDGSRITVTDSQAVAIVYSTGPNRRADGLNASYSTTYQAGETTPDYDDLLVWIGRPLLIARLAQAGRL